MFNELFLQKSCLRSYKRFSQKGSIFMIRKAIRYADRDAEQRHTPFYSEITVVNSRKSPKNALNYGCEKISFSRGYLTESLPTHLFTTVSSRHRSRNLLDQRTKQGQKVNHKYRSWVFSPYRSWHTAHRKKERYYTQSLKYQSKTHCNLC